jgi:hypothetical protein
VTGRKDLKIWLIMNVNIVIALLVIWEYPLKLKVKEFVCVVRNGKMQKYGFRRMKSSYYAVRRKNERNPKMKLDNADKAILGLVAWLESTTNFKEGE